MIFRAFYPRGLTALDDFNEVSLGTRPTMSHATGRREVANLLNSTNSDRCRSRWRRKRRATQQPRATATRL